MIKAFPRTAVMDRKMLKTKININWPLISGGVVKPDQHNNCSNVFCFPSAEKFAVDITLRFSHSATDDERSGWLL